MVDKKLLEEIRFEHVISAISNFHDGVQHEFAPSRKYDVLHEGRRTPLRAVVALAIRSLNGTELTPKAFSGAVDAACQRRLAELGFDIESKPDEGKAASGVSRASEWSEVECYFAVWGYDQLDLNRDLQKTGLYSELSDLIGRSPKAVEFKIQNASACDPRPRAEKPINEAQHKQGLLKVVFDRYWRDREAARQGELFMREALKFPEEAATRGSQAGFGSAARGSLLIEEGAATHTAGVTRVRSRPLVQEGRRHFRATDPEGRLRCKACGYTAPDCLPPGVEIVQLHHAQPLSDVSEGGRQLDLQSAIDQLVPLCPTCHVLAHTSRPPLSVEAIRSICQYR